MVLNSFFPNPSAECAYAKTSFFKEWEGSIHYLAAFNPSVSRGLDQNCPPLVIELRWEYQGPMHWLKLDKLSDVVWYFSE